MLKKSFSLILVTLAFGILYGCGSSNPFIDEAKSALKANNPQGVLQAAEQSIQNTPSDPLGYYYKGVALGDIADTKEASNRADDYKEMNDSFLKAKQIADTSKAETPSEISGISVIKTNLWRLEFNKSVEYATNDSVMQTVAEPLKESIYHMKNATVIIPDSTRSWNVLAQLAYNDQDFDLAISAKEEAFKRSEKPEPDDYSNLAAYYASSNDIKGTIKVLENGVEKYPGNTRLTTTLADAYQQSGETEKAIAIVEKLVQENPDNMQYRLSLGSQIYQSAIKLSDQVTINSDKLLEMQSKLNNASGSDKKEIQSKLNTLNSETEALQAKYDALSKRATTQLEKVIEARPNDATANNILGIIYQNKAAALFDKRNRTKSNEKAAEIDKEAEQVLRKSMGYYEQAAEIDPDNQDYWRSLFNIYTTLGMDEKANEAEKKAGFDQ